MRSTLTDITGKVVVVTGGAHGIGRALGEEALRRGARLVLADVETGRLDQTVAELSEHGEVLGVRTDVADPAQVEELAERTYERFGACHVLFNNAGVGAPAALPWETTPNDWRWVHGVNVLGVAHGVQSFVPRMLAAGETGWVVNTSSGDGAVNALPKASVYAASKAAVAVLTECLAAQLEEDGAPLGASLFLPAGGLLDTGMWTADRNRPAELAREVPRASPVMTVQAVVEGARAAGREIRVQPLDELAVEVFDGVLAGRYLLTLSLDRYAETLRRRADQFAAADNPLVRESAAPV